MLVIVDSNKHKKQFKIQRMSEYDIETSMDIPADHFNIIIDNPVGPDGHGVNAEMLNPNDRFRIYEDNEIILDGMADDLDETWGEEGAKIEIDGRDRSMLLLENDAEPKTYYKLKFSDFLKKIAAPYGFTNFQVNPIYDKVIDKIVVEVGDSEWDTLFRECKKLGMWLWCTSNSTIIADVLNYKEEPSYTFSNDMSISNAIRMKRFSKRKRGADIKSEVWVRGHSKKTFTAKFKDTVLTALGYARRMIIENGDAKNIAEGEKIAKRYVDERKRGSFEIEITINGRHKIETNKTAYVKDKVTKTDGVFFVVGVRHKKNNNVGNEKIIRLRPLWEGL
ncbi:hypothetical protein FQB35_10385 [Crassaminicella thermophila]|uniref:Phage protein D n=1 Tax=Crassaminicella thermophila TaxID=2599308 RepID=A0A5C0SG38_CRATE|nr:hypothetical protein [Crassaminicella thermophila]QEK12706.1 hypothetical protein FQB35_10385 [Crassaminicella thermophila]